MINEQLQTILCIFQTLKKSKRQEDAQKKYFRLKRKANVKAQ